MMRLKIGETVKSIAIGAEPAFNGIITDFVDPPRDKGPKQYVITRADGTSWLRKAGELYPPEETTL